MVGYRPEIKRKISTEYKERSPYSTISTFFSMVYSSSQCRVQTASMTELTVSHHNCTAPEMKNTGKAPQTIP